ncbi:MULTISPECIES: hypothetical protein [unclassified Sphingobacterium]|uniref:hypothetical protein n=1 Tax=unclassified Sphingobacterium TaxID=2609468 RepID=UPI0025F1E8F1|nr:MULTISPECIES: hypothetical protein [unclassified Sphingobacterium]
MNDLLKSINLRLNNPFILSFCISWIFWNWPIVVGLIWYNSSSIEKLGYENYTMLIKENANPWRNYIWPTVFALAYPFVKWFFSWVQTWVGIKEEKTIKIVSGKGYVPTSRYLRVVEQYEADVLKLSKIIEDEGILVAENIQLKTQITEKDAELSKSNGVIKGADDKLINMEEKTKIKMFDGNWEIKYRDESLNFVFAHQYHIRDGEGYNYENYNKSGVFKTEINIASYIMNPFENKFSIALRLNGGRILIYPNCYWNEDYTQFEGGNRLQEQLANVIMTKIN